MDYDLQKMAADAIAHAAYMTQETIRGVMSQYELPSVLYRPKVFIDGDQWCALYGDNIQDGVAGFGDSPELAMHEFNTHWRKRIRKGE